MRSVMPQAIENSVVASSRKNGVRSLHASPWLAVFTLAQREWIRFIRQRNRVFGALGQPLIFWLLFGAGLGPSFQLRGATEGLSYSEYFFPGTVILILLFTAIFATISIIEDRREGFLQSVLVAPLPRWVMVLGKVLGGSLIALAQGLLFLMLGFTLGMTFSVVSLLASVVFLFLVAFALVSLGFVMAWRLDSTQGFHALMSVFLMPMWLLSGAFFPPGSGVLAWIIRLNPLTYGVAGLRQLLYWQASPDVRSQALPPTLPSMEMSLVVTLLFAISMFFLACVVSKQRTAGDLL
jgi:ABC-2 type transport system permease protein